MRTEDLESMVQALAHILQDHGDGVLDGSHSLTLLTPNLQVVTRLFEQLFPRGPGSGFQALPAHPTDSGAVLGSQFVLDLVQKTPGLKLIHPEECPRQCDVNIFPFKSLKHLEVRHLPPHCLRGLRGVYSQLEVLTCSECVTSIEEVISSCGGDLSSALPWLELHTLNFSNNNIHSLDQSLELLNSLRSLNLSRNFIKDCGPHLKILSELQDLNLGYNLLESIPELSLQSSVQLHTLILSHNRLSSVRGLEHLSNLQHLNLSYNMLAHPLQLTCLSRLHNLKELFLKGNPLCYVPEHRALTAQQLSHKAFDKVFLDGEQITTLEIAMTSFYNQSFWWLLLFAPKSLLFFPQTDHVYRERIILPQCFNSAIESSCTGELSESGSAPERIATRISRKKSKIKVRRASISEPSDSECEREPRSQPVVVLQHQKDIERTDSFRDQFGDDWLQYRSHLEEELNKDKNGNESPRRPVFSQPFTKSKSSPIILQTAGRTDSLSPVPANPGPARPPTPEVGTVTAAADLLIEKIEDVLEDRLWQPDIDNKEEEEEETIEDALCLPVTVCPILDGRPLNPEWPWVFVRVTHQHLLEIDLERGRILRRRELQSLRDIQTSVTQWDWNEEEQEFPVLTLFFHSVCEEKQCARYVVLDNTSEISIKTLLDVLNPILEENLRLIAEREEGPPKLKCLKCKTEFIHQDDSGVVLSAEGEGQTQDNNQPDHTGCPSCGSFHVILAPVDHTSYSSTPTQSSPSDLPPEGAENRGQKFYLAGDERDGSEISSCLGGSDSILNGTTTSDANVTGLNESFRSSTATPPVRHNSMVLQDNWQVSPTSVSPHQILDFRLVDHRLKLYLDMEILGGDMEEFQCYMKVPVVRFGKEGAFWALVVVSNRKIYFLEITGETSGPPCDWLRPAEEQSLTSFTHLHIGLQKQTLHLGFGTPEAAYTLLTRNCHFSTAFAQNILDSMCELPPRYRNALDYSVEEEVTPGHHLWHLLHDNLEEGDHSPGEYRYVLAYFMQDVSADKPENLCANDTVVPQNTASPAALAQGAANATAVTLLLTHTHMYILEETHQWLHSPSPAGEDSGQEPADKVQVKEKQPISSISSVHLYSSATLHLRIKLYNETQQKESSWLLWTENPDLPKEIAEWLRVPWEAEYHIHFNPVIHETLD
ncbi:serine/threonine-protein kinase 11-interacting protein isoform X3 [Lithobates pipiens]